MRRRPISIYDPFDSVAKMRHVEVDEQADLTGTELQVRQNLRQVKGKQFLHCLQLDDDEILDKKIDPISGIKAYALIDHRKPDLMVKVQTVNGELVLQARLIGALEKPRSEGGVDLDGRINDSTCDVVVKHMESSTVSTVSSVVAMFE